MKWVIVATVIAGFLFVDFLTPLALGIAMFGGEWIAAIFLGICTGQINLIAAWAALGPGNIAWRLPWSLLLGVLMWYSLVLGSRADDPYYSFNEAVTLGVILLGGIVTAQVPLWIAKRAYQWRMVGWSGTPPHSGREAFQFRLRHLFAGILILSIALAPARAVLPPGSLRGVDLEGEAIAALIVMTVFSLLIAVPCVWGVFFEKSRFGSLRIGWLVYCAMLTAIEFALLVAVLGPPGRMEFAMLLAFYLLNVTQCVTVYGTLLIFRALGVRLVRLVSAEPSAIEERGGAEEV